MLGTGLDRAYKQILCIVLALKQLTALTLVKVVEWMDSGENSNLNNKNHQGEKFLAKSMISYLKSLFI